MKKHKRGWVSNDRRWLIEKEEIETECGCLQMPEQLAIRCPHEGGQKIEIRWFVYNLGMVHPDDVTTGLDGRNVGLPDAVADFSTLKEAREFLQED